MRTVRRLAARFVALWRAADRAVRTAGVQWYRNARRICRDLARRHGVSESCAAGVVAALSPRLGWTYNVLAADLVLARAERVPGVFKASLVKARRILAGGRPLQVLSGPKVRAFYRALKGDESAAVVDVWTARAAGLSPEHLKSARRQRACRRPRGLLYAAGPNPVVPHSVCISNVSRLSV
jgi:hypothetical protein